MSEQATVFIVDDNEAMRYYLRAFLEDEGFAVRAYASSRAFLEAYSPEGPGCLLLDVNMPGMSGLELQSRLQANGVAIPSIFMSGYGDIPMAVQAMQGGAVDFIEKPFRQQVLLNSLRRALEIGQARWHASAMAREARALIENLTNREQEVLERLVQGQANKVIARELGISDRTVEVHRKHVMRKLRARSLSKVVRIAYQAERTFVDAQRFLAA